ncbi:predicted protein [Chaetoceros tenuissimus]|uniref:Uncharacterized protein n=1 Tax=Chaetoceros tenuissimus TaxID=426638 RepID=A0AAD3D2Y7_9STRA|nr:predicted protein [Chaetoceros tenuissimus]
MFKTFVTYSERGEKSHSAEAIRGMVSKMIKELEEIRKHFKNPFSKPKELNKFLGKLKKKGIVKKMIKGKKFYSCKRYIFSKDKTQGLILNAHIKNMCHLVSTNTKKFCKETFFFSDRVEVIALKDVLSDDALKGQAYLFQLHNTAPLNITSQCKVGALPVENRLRQGANDAEARAFLGTNHCDEYHAMITGRSCKLSYQNKDGEWKTYHLENPCSRTTYGSGNDPGFDAYTSFQNEWEAKGIQPNFGVIQPFVDQYLQEIKLITKEYLPYFFGKNLDDEKEMERMKNAFFDSKFQLTTNLVNRVHLSGGHVDTPPACKNFPSIIAIQTNRELDGEGELAFPSLGFRLQYQTGDVVLMRPDLFHGICPMNSDMDRYLAVFYNNHTNFRCK